MVKNKKRLLNYLFLFLSLGGCTSVHFKNFFVGYAQQMTPVRSALLLGDVQQSTSQLPEQNSPNKVLYQLEQGRLSYLANDWDRSQAAFDAVYQQVQLNEAKAKIQISKGIEQLGAVVSNDNVMTYQIPAYELGMMHSYQAMNYLYQHDLQGALVEIRRANQVQEKALKQHQAELFSAANSSSEKSYADKDSDENEPDWRRVNQAYANMDKQIGELKNGFQNAYTFYLSGLLYEAAGEENDAYIDYKRALEITPDNTFVQQDVLRLATRLGMTDDLIELEQKFGRWQDKKTQGDGQVIVLYEQGLVNDKQELALHLPVSIHDDIRFYNVALPIYENTGVIPQPLTLMFKDTSVTSMEIVRLQSLAAKQLYDQLPGLILRQLSRLIAKEKIRSTLSRKGNDVGNILANLYNVLSEKADTRSWLTLPDNAQILKAALSPGQQTVEVMINGRVKTLELDIKANRTTIVNLTTIDNFFNYKSVTL